MPIMMRVALFPLRHPASFLLPALFLFFTFYVPGEERRFLRDMQNAFQATSEDTVLLKEIVPSDWDYVCYVGQDTGTMGLREEAWPEALSIRHRIRSYASPFYKGSFWFVSNGEVSKRLDYNTWGLRLTEHGVLPLHISVGKQPYLFLSENAFEDEPCQDSDHAALKRQVSRTGTMTSFLILLTSIERK